MDAKIFARVVTIETAPRSWEQFLLRGEHVVGERIQIAQAPPQLDDRYAVRILCCHQFLRNLQRSHHRDAIVAEDLSRGADCFHFLIDVARTRDQVGTLVRFTRNAIAATEDGEFQAVHYFALRSAGSSSCGMRASNASRRVVAAVTFARSAANSAVAAAVCARSRVFSSFSARTCVASSASLFESASSSSSMRRS